MIVDEAGLSAALSALEGICPREPGDVVISAGGALSLFRETEGLEWVDTKEKSRHLLRRLGFRSATHRSERFWGRDQPDMAKETARGTRSSFTRCATDQRQLDLPAEMVDAAQRDLPARYATNLEPLQASHPNAQNGFM